MNGRVLELLTEVLKLPSQDRAEFATELIASLDESEDDPAAVEAEWASEIDKRVRGALAGQPAENWPDVKTRIERRLIDR